MTAKSAGGPGGAGERAKRQAVKCPKGEGDGAKRPGAEVPEGEGERRRFKFPIFESMGQAARALKISEPLLKAAKRQGCTAFISGSRIDSLELVIFLLAKRTQGNDLPAGMASWAEVLTMEKARREEIKRQQDETRLMLVDDACRQAAIAATHFFEGLSQQERELPPVLAGGTAVDICKRLHSFNESLRKSCQEKFEAIGKAE